MINDGLAHWRALMESGNLEWTEDQIFRLMGHGLFFYTGDDDGLYMKISKDGLVEAGTYEDAFPHIEKASLTAIVKKQFADYKEAYAGAWEEDGSSKILTEMFGGEPEPPEGSGAAAPLPDAHIFAAWQALAGENPAGWREDIRYRKYKDGALYYLGEESGQYIRIHNDGRLTIGSYELASPDIREAVLIACTAVSLGSYERAFLFAVQLGGERFLSDLSLSVPETGRGTVSEKPSVLGQIRAAKKAPQVPKYPRSQKKNKGGPEL